MIIEYNSLGAGQSWQSAVGESGAHVYWEYAEPASLAIGNRWTAADPFTLQPTYSGYGTHRKGLENTSLDIW